MATNIANHPDKRTSEEKSEIPAKLNAELMQPEIASTSSLNALVTQLHLAKQNNENRFNEGVSYALTPCIAALEGALEPIAHGNSDRAHADITLLLGMLKRLK